MKSRAARVLLLVVALAGQLAAGYKVWSLEQEATAARAAAEAFDRQGRQLVAGLADLRAAQQAYVAAGQGEEFWFQKVTSLMQALTPRLVALRKATSIPESTSALEAATESLTSFGQLDQRARDFVKSNQRLSASDLIFTDGVEVTAKASARIDDARARELEGRAAASLKDRWIEAYVVIAAALVTLIVVLLLVPIPRTAAADEDRAAAGSRGGLGLSQISPPHPDHPGGHHDDDRLDLIRLDEGHVAYAPDLAGVAGLCTELARVQETRELPPLLEKAATLLNASGLIVWIADAPHGDLRPVLAHGYSTQVLARMGTIPAEADNATAAAFRSGAVQVVQGDAQANGALVVPLSTAGGITGAMAAEVRDGREADVALRSLAAIVAAQLATLFTPAAAPPVGTRP